MTGHLTARAGESLDRLGRLWGFGWSNGYHACGAEPYHFGKNMPPHSYAAQHAIYPASSTGRSVHSEHAASNRAGCPNGNCDQSWAPEQWQINGLPAMPTFAPDPVPMEAFQSPTITPHDAPYGAPRQAPRQVAPLRAAPVEVLPPPIPESTITRNTPLAAGTQSNTG